MMATSTPTSSTSSTSNDPGPMILPVPLVPWSADNPTQQADAKRLDIWPLDEFNAALLNQVHPRGYTMSTEAPHEIYDLIAIGAGAGGLVSAKQSARRGAKSAMISEHLAGGDCLNMGCVPSKALIRAAKAIRQVRHSADFGVVWPEGTTVQVDFDQIMRRMRKLRTEISPADGHDGTSATGAHVFQGRGIFTGPDTIQVMAPKDGRADHDDANDAKTILVRELKFKTAVIATGGRPQIPDIPGLAEAPYTTNENLFNLESLPPRMVIIGAGVVALEMAQCFATFGSHVTVLQRSARLFESTYGDAEAAKILQAELEQDGVHFLSSFVVKRVTTLRGQRGSEDNTTSHPLLQVTVKSKDDNDDAANEVNIECECLLVAAGRLPNVEHLGLDAAGVEYETGLGIVVNDKAQSVSNPKVYAVGDCVKGVPRLTHVSGEMAKLVVQNSLFKDNWKLSSLVIPAVMYTEPEYATVGINSEEMAAQKGMAVEVYRAGLEHNDRAILESANVGFCKVLCRRGTDEIVGATIVAERAGEMINEITLAMKNNIGLRAIGRNIHAYPTTGEAVMGAGIQYINANWKRLN